MVQVQNPILPGFHPDPSVIRIDDTYYAANSTFEWFPGVEIHKSKDLLHWELAGHPLTRTSQLDMRGVLNSGGVWAPCLSYDGNMFYLVYSIVHTFDEFTQDNNNYLVTAEHIEGPWSEPIYLNSGGFDASLFHDSDGSKWLLNMMWDAHIEHNHFRGIEMQEYSPKEKKLVGKRTCIFNGTERGLTEGPHMYQYNGYYYLLTAEGGTSENHCITMARSRFRQGPFEVDDFGPILTSKDRADWPIQYAGHGDIVDDGNNNWYLFHLGSRKNIFRGYSVLGRETFLQNVQWTEDGWLRLSEGGHLPKPKANVQAMTTTDAKPQTYPMFYGHYTFEEGVDPAFMSLRIPQDENWATTKERPDFLRLKGRESLASKFEQSLLAIRIQDIHFQASTLLEFEPEDYRQRAGLTFYYHSANYYYLFVGTESDGNRILQLERRDGRKTTMLLNEGVPLPQEGAIELKGNFAPSGLRFFRKVQGKDWKQIEIDETELPVYIMSDEYANVCGEQGFTGAFVGICCQDLTGQRKAADFRWFDIARNGENI